MSHRIIKFSASLHEEFNEFCDSASATVVIGGISNSCVDEGAHSKSANVLHLLGDHPVEEESSKVRQFVFDGFLKDGVSWEITGGLVADTQSH